jgi:oxygen-dependent protoporphyrinogen oxidase
MPKIAIVGGGVSGLAAAYRIERLSKDARVTLFEASDRLGGNIRTDTSGGFVLEAGPDSWVTTKPEARALAKELGLEGECIDTIEENRRVYVAFGKELHALPEGLVLGVPTKIAPLVATNLFGWDAKLRMGLELLIPKKDWHDGDDESIASFFTRRFGEELTDRLAAPLLGGIFAGDASELSIRAAFPQLVEMEKNFGSLVRAMRSAPPRRGKGGSMFQSLRGGMHAFVDRLASSLVRTEIKAAHAVRNLERSARWMVDGEAFDDVILTAPGFVLTDLVRGFDTKLADLFGELRYASTATVLLGFAKADVKHPLDATGFLVPRSLGRPMLACTFASSKWPNRAPPGHALIRVFFNDSVLDRSDDDLVLLAREELERWLGPLGQTRISRVNRYERASPQPMLGHLARMQKIHGRLEDHPGLHLAGNGYDGSGIPDCIKQSDRAARAALART